MKVSLNGSIVDKEDAVIPAESDGLFYGVGCFETFTSYKGKFLHLDRHIHRLNDAVTYLTGVQNDLFSEEILRAEIAELLEENGLTDDRSRVRFQASIGGRTGYSHPKSKDAEIITLMSANKISGVPPTPINLASVNTTVVPASSKPAHLKLSNMLHYRQASIEAKAKGADDALMLTVNGMVAETSIANIFWEKDGTVYTPSASCDILPGITRSIIIELVNRDDLEFREGEFSLSDVKQASQIWVCNSLKELLWVSILDGKSYSADTPLKHKLLNTFNAYKMEHLA